MSTVPPHISPRLYAMPGYALSQTGWYLEVETDRIVRVDRLPVSGLMVTAETWIDGEEMPIVHTYRAETAPHRFRGPLPAPSKLFA